MELCSPALIYLIFSLTQVIVDSIKGLYNLALAKFITMVLFTLVLNILCERGLGVISWIIVFVPFILMSVITGILLFIFGLDPSSGKIITPRRHVREPRVYVDEREEIDYPEPVDDISTTNSSARHSADATDDETLQQKLGKRVNRVPHHLHNTRNVLSSSEQLRKQEHQHKEQLHRRENILKTKRTQLEKQLKENKKQEQQLQ